MTSKVDTSKLAQEQGLDLPLISSYTRAQEIEDVVLIDVTETAKETGFRFPVAVTSEIWHGYVSLHYGTPRSTPSIK